MINLSLETSTWTKIDATGTIPSPRAWGTLSLVGTKLYLLCGTNGSVLFNDIYILDTGKYHHVVYTTDCTKLRTCGVHQMLLVINHKAAIAIVRLCWQQIFTCMVDLVTESFSRFPTYMCFLHRITLGQQQSFLDKHLLLVTGKSIQLFSLNLLVIAPILWARTCLCLVAA